MQNIHVKEILLFYTRGCNIRSGIREAEWESVDWMNLAQNGRQWRALVNTVMNLRGVRYTRLNSLQLNQNCCHRHSESCCVI